MQNSDISWICVTVHGSAAHLLAGTLCVRAQAAWGGAVKALAVPATAAVVSGTRIPLCWNVYATTQNTSDQQDAVRLDVPKVQLLNKLRLLHPWQNVDKQ